LDNSDGGCVAAGTTATADLRKYGGDVAAELVCIDNGGNDDD